MSRITITIPNELIDELMAVVEARSKTDAVLNAIKSQIMQKKKQKIIDMVGKINFTSDARDLRHGDERLG
jgi:metal-responsive CopG/Arc/MetJ family transcriptional regulator